MRLFKFFSKYLKLILLYFNHDVIENKLEKLHNIHSGEECYIFGDGVSIKYFDLSLFKDKVSIVSNNLIFHKDFDKLNVKYYSMFEPYWFFPIFVSGLKGIRFIYNKIQRAHLKNFKSKPNIIFFTDLSNVLRLKGKNIVPLHYSILSKYFSLKENSINMIEGTLRIQITLAIIMGFKKAYLVGHDYTHKNPYVGHFYEAGEGEIDNKKNWNQSFFDLVKNKIDLTTITLNGTSSTINSITYTEFTNADLNFKENTEIVNKKNIEILSSWPGYRL